MRTLRSGVIEIDSNQLQELKAGFCPICDRPNIDSDDPKIKRIGHYTYTCINCETEFVFNG